MITERKFSLFSILVMAFAIMFMTAACDNPNTPGTTDNSGNSNGGGNGNGEEITVEEGTEYDRYLAKSWDAQNTEYGSLYMTLNEDGTGNGKIPVSSKTTIELEQFTWKTCTWSDSVSNGKIMEMLEISYTDPENNESKTASYMLISATDSELTIYPNGPDSNPITYNGYKLSITEGTEYDRYLAKSWTVTDAEYGNLHMTLNENGTGTNGKFVTSRSSNGTTVKWNTVTLENFTWKTYTWSDSVSNTKMEMLEIYYLEDNEEQIEQLMLISVTENELKLYPFGDGYPSVTYSSIQQ